MMHDMNDDASLPNDPNPEPILTVAELTVLLYDMPPDAPVMMTVVKYPDEFSFKTDASTGTMRWDSGTDTEQQPLTQADVILMDGIACLVVELDDYDPDRAKG